MTAARLVTRLLTQTKCQTLHLPTKGPTLGSQAEQARAWRVRRAQQRVRWAQRRVETRRVVLVVLSTLLRAFFTILKQGYRVPYLLVDAGSYGFSTIPPLATPRTTRAPLSVSLGFAPPRVFGAHRRQS